MQEKIKESKNHSTAGITSVNRIYKALMGNDVCRAIEKF